jgi:hypothetical protein
MRGLLLPLVLLGALAVTPAGAAPPGYAPGRYESPPRGDCVRGPGRGPGRPGDCIDGPGYGPGGPGPGPK